MPPSRDPFLQQILDRPESDGPRLVDADWLAERGDPRGEYIRLQIALARLPAGDPSAVDLERREQALAERHYKEWTKSFNGKVSRCGFRRGFVEAITLPARAFLEHAPKLFAAAPIRTV